MKKSMMTFDVLIKNGRLFTMDEQFTHYQRASIGIKNKKIAWIGEDDSRCDAHQIIDAFERVVTPGLIDCHTHLIYAGNRAKDFEARMNGQSYTDIAEAGGGIMSTVRATQSASEQELLEYTYKRAHCMLMQGTTTIEVKSGYGLLLEHEVKMLKVAKQLKAIIPMNIIPTFLALHALPKDFLNQNDYVQKVIHDFLPVIAKQHLAINVDAFCENIAFTPEETQQLFSAAQSLGFQLKLHAEQLSDQKGALLAGQFNAISVDHLEYLHPNDCQQLANGYTVAVLLPGAFYFLREKQRPPIEALRLNDIPMAIATDHNPGTSPFLSLPLMMNMACVFFGLTVKEAWLGVTQHAAKALNMHHAIGMIKVGYMADLIIWDCETLEEVILQPNVNLCRYVFQSGKMIPAIRKGFY